MTIIYNTRGKRYTRHPSIGASLEETREGEYRRYTFLTAYTVGTKAAIDAVQGLTPEILVGGTLAYKWVSADAYKTVFLVSLAASHSVEPPSS